MERLHAMFEAQEDESWSFADTRTNDYLTHGYHRYPAKFVPQLVGKLINTYTQPGDRIADVFAGCGTTLVESKVHGRRSTGVDINPVAQFITRVKTQPIRPAILVKAFEQLSGSFIKYNPEKSYCKVDHHAKIDYWFEPENKNKIAFLYGLIKKQCANKKAAEFFLCAMSHILKNCSRWLQDSTKPQIDPKKTLHDVFACFNVQSKRMIEKNEEFYTLLKKEGRIKTTCNIKLADARRTSIHAGTVNTIITSPPYVTSYEYAEIHQLTAYWFEYMTDIATFRKNFIGSFYSYNQNTTVEHSTTGQDIVNQLKPTHDRIAKEVANYFEDMYQVAREMMRILVVGGRACVVIGNTELRKVKIKSAESFAEILMAVGFEIENVIKRSIPNKHMPSIRDKESGRFTKMETSTSKLVYPNEYIIIAKKPS